MDRILVYFDIDETLICKKDNLKKLSKFQTDNLYKETFSMEVPNPMPLFGGEGMIVVQYSLLYRELHRAFFDTALNAINMEVRLNTYGRYEKGKIFTHVLDHLSPSLAPLIDKCESGYIDQLYGGGIWELYQFYQKNPHLGDPFEGAGQSWDVEKAIQINHFLQTHPDYADVKPCNIYLIDDNPQHRAAAEKYNFSVIDPTAEDYPVQLKALMLQIKPKPKEATASP